MLYLFTHLEVGPKSSPKCWSASALCTWERGEGVSYREEARGTADLANDIASGGKNTSPTMLGGDALDTSPVLTACGAAALAEVEAIEQAVNTLVPFLVLGRRVLVGLGRWNRVSTVLLLTRECLVLLGRLLALLAILLAILLGRLLGPLAILLLRLAVLSGNSGGQDGDGGDRELHFGGSIRELVTSHRGCSTAECTVCWFVKTLKVVGMLCFALETMG